MDNDDMELTAGDEGFNPDKCQCDRADWVVKEEGKPVTFFSAALSDDDDSPSGLAFSYEAYRIDENGCLDEVDGGMFWDFSAADQLLDEGYPRDFVCAVRLNEGAIDEIPEPFTVPDGDSWKAAAGKVVCDAVDKLPAGTDQAGIFAVPEAYKDIYRKMHRDLDLAASIDAAKKAASGTACKDRGSANDIHQ